MVVVGRNVRLLQCAEFDFSGMEIIWGSRYTVTEHQKAVEWEEKTTSAAASLSRARRRKEPVLLCEGSASSKRRYAHVNGMK